MSKGDIHENHSETSPVRMAGTKDKRGSTGRNAEKREPLVRIVGEIVMVLTANSKLEIELL